LQLRDSKPRLLDGELRMSACRIVVMRREGDLGGGERLACRRPECMPSLGVCDRGVRLVQGVSRHLPTFVLPRAHYRPRENHHPQAKSNKHSSACTKEAGVFVE
jgi:hypothetical protein